MFSFKNIKNKTVSEKKIDNPYLAAKNEWNELYGSLISSRKSWQIIAFFCAVTAIILAVGIVFVAMQSKIIPYAIHTDKLGMPISIQRVDPETKADSSLIMYELAKFIKDVRTISPDGKLKKTMMEEAKAICSEAALNTLNSYWNNNPPDKAAQIMSISVQIVNVLPINNTNSWQINWIETASQNGTQLGQTHWTAIAQVGTMSIGLLNEQLIYKNPAAILVKSISWSQSS